MQFTKDDVETLEVMYEGATNYCNKLRTIRKPTDEQLIQLTAYLTRLSNMRAIIAAAKADML